jgi:hypothetical protein
MRKSMHLDYYVLLLVWDGVILFASTVSVNQPISKGPLCNKITQSPEAIIVSTLLMFQWAVWLNLGAVCH